MKPIENATIPIHAAPIPVAEQPKPAKPRWKFRIPRSVLIVFYIAVAVAVGWGGWSCFAPASKTDSAEVIADFEGFTSAPAYPIAAKTEDKTASESDERTNSVGLPADLPTSDVASTTIALPTESNRAADVWFTGTIEEVETNGNGSADFSVRLSSGSNDPGSFR